MNKLSIVFSISLLMINTAFSQQKNCTTIINELVSLKEKLSDSNPDSYYDMAMHLLKNRRSKCIDSNERTKWGKYLTKGIDLGSVKAAYQLGKIYYLGQLIPTNYRLAHEYYLKGAASLIKKVFNDTATKDDKLYGWINFVEAMWLVKNGRVKQDEKASSDYLQFIENTVPYTKENIRKHREGKTLAPLNSYYDLMGAVYAEGLYGKKIDAEKGIEFTYYYYPPDGYEVFYNLVLKENKTSKFRNEFAEYLLAVNCLSDINCGKEDTRAYAFQYFNKYHTTITGYKAFENKFNALSEEMKEFLNVSMRRYKTLEKKWELVSNPKFLLTKADPKWEFLPRSERVKMINEAKKERKSSLDARKRLIIFLSMLKNGNNEAYYYLGNAHRFGYGLPSSNEEKALEYYKKSVTLAKNKDAAYKLAVLYDKGNGDIKQDWTKAANYYELSGEDNPDALRNLGEMYLFGVGGKESNYNTAKEYFKLAADKGDSKSSSNLQILNFILSDALALDPISTFKADNIELSYNLFKVSSPNKKKKGAYLKIPINYKVTKNDFFDYIKIFPSKDRRFRAKITFTNYSASPNINGTGTFSLEIKEYGANRQIGALYVTYTADNETKLAFSMPMAICWVDDEKAN